MKHWRKHVTKDRVWAFIGGAAAATIGVKAAKSEKAKELAVKSLAKGMTAHKSAMSTINNIKEDAQDLCHEAREAAKEEDE